MGIEHSHFENPVEKQEAPDVSVESMNAPDGMRAITNMDAAYRNEAQQALERARAMLQKDFGAQSK